mmetsp:Transcript_44537/g.123345  ORF Transcript_44537/g.123345 Transcript_44537/m.123345 type:complete len:186 (-) Transcript_44537:78-635(-)
MSGTAACGGGEARLPPSEGFAELQRAMRRLVTSALSKILCVKTADISPSLDCVATDGSALSTEVWAAQERTSIAQTFVDRATELHKRVLEEFRVANHFAGPDVATGCPDGNAELTVEEDVARMMAQLKAQSMRQQIQLLRQRSDALAAISAESEARGRKLSKELEASLARQQQAFDCVMAPVGGS